MARRPRDELDDLRDSLLHRLRVPLGPEDGDEAFDEHILLATKIHRAARVSSRRKKEGEGEGWIRFVTDFFPAGRNDPADAKLIWVDWRVGILKDRSPFKGIALTHGQPGIHWQRDEHGALVLDLESLADDFEYAVDEFIAALRADPAWAKRALEQWRERSWTVRPFRFERQQSLGTVSGFTGVFPVGTAMGTTAAPAVSATPAPARKT